MATSSSATTASSSISASTARASSTSSRRPLDRRRPAQERPRPPRSGIDLLLAPPSPETAELVRQDDLPQILDVLRTLYDYVLIDIDKRLDEINLRVLDAADTIFVVMTADLSCLKNVRLVLETIGHLGYEGSKVHLVLNRSNAFTGISVKSAEGALRRTIDNQVVNEYRRAISSLNSGAPFMYTRADSLLGQSLLEFVRSIAKMDIAVSKSPVPVPAR